MTLTGQVALPHKDSQKRSIETGSQLSYSEHRVSQKIFYNPGNSFSGCLTRRVINAARILLFKSTNRVNNLSSDKKHNFKIGRLIFSY